MSCCLRNDGYGLITIDLDDCFISIKFLNWDIDMNKVVHTKAEIEELADQMKFVQYQMGHSEIQTTYDIYVSVTENFKQKEIKSFEDYMRVQEGWSRNIL